MILATIHGIGNTKDIKWAAEVANLLKKDPSDHRLIQWETLMDSLIRPVTRLGDTLRDIEAISIEKVRNFVWEHLGAFRLEADDKQEQLVIISHSMGTWLCYEMLHKLPKMRIQPEVIWVTIGSPLSKLRMVTNKPDTVTNWCNVWGRFDLVATSPWFLRNGELKGADKNIRVTSGHNMLGRWGYLRHLERLLPEIGITPEQK